MRAYKNIRFTEFPDVGDICNEGRASHVGKLPGKSGDYRPYKIRRRATRRYLKRINARLDMRFERAAE
jgi:hypothetical protein